MPTVLGGVGIVTQLIMVLMAVIIIGLLSYLIINLLKYKHYMRIKKIANDGRKVVFDDRFAEIIDKDGIRWWRLLKNKNLSLTKKGLIQIAPSEAIEIDKKGRMVVEAYALDTGEVIYAKDIVKGMPQDLTPEGKKLWLAKNKVVDAYQPLTTKQRLMFIKQIRKAEEKKKTDWKQNIPMLIGIGAAVIILIALLVFWEDMAKPLLTMSERLESFQVRDMEMLEIVRDIKYGVQRIEGDNRTIQAPVD